MDILEDQKMHAEAEILDALAKLEMRYLTGIRYIDGIAFMPAGLGKTCKIKRIPRAKFRLIKAKQKASRASRRRNRR